MAFPVEISYKDVPHSDRLERLIREEAAKLERYYGRIISGRVVVEHVHHRAPFHARVELSVPGEGLIVRGSEKHETFMTEELAVRNAFRIAKRQLIDYADRLKS
jgi:ribosome-associated translation inhibitor RaiA